MTKNKASSKAAARPKRLPQAGIIYAIRSQDIVAIGPVPANEHNELQMFNSNNNKIIKNQFSETSWNCTDTENSSMSSPSPTTTEKSAKESCSSFSSDNIMQHLFIDSDPVVNNRNQNNSVFKNQNSLIVHRGSLVSQNKSKNSKDQSVTVSDLVTRPSDSLSKDISDGDKRRHKEKSKRMESKSEKSKHRHSLILSKPIEKISGKRNEKRSDRRNEAMNDKRSEHFSGKKSDRHTEKVNEKLGKKTKSTAITEPSTSVTDTQISTPIFDSKSYRNPIQMKIEKEVEESDSCIEIYQQRNENDLISRYKDQCMELSKLKVKLNELTLENGGIRQMLDNLTMEINNLRYENSSVKTRNETLAARSLENQNLSRIVESLNKRIKELCQEIETCQTRESEKNRKLLELAKCLQDSQDKESSVSVELEHLRMQLTQKEIELKKVTFHQKADDAKDFHIKMIHNELIELRGNIRVLCRIKPESSNCIQILNNETLQLPPIKSKMVFPVFNFNRVFRPNCSQSDMFAEVRQLVHSFVDGYNVSVITYGQSGTGKTHTMIGSKEDPGIVTHSIREIFKLCKQRSTWSYKICLSVLEIYNETIFDLLSTTNSVKPLWKKRTQIHDDGKCIHIKGLSEIEIQHEEELVHFITRSGKSRSSCVTSQNSDSSRSHFIVMLRIYGKSSFQNTSCQGVLMLCDLAGSENCSSTLCDNSLTESKYISKSLTVLGRVFEALYNKLTVIPFRDSKLTHMLKPSLSGDAKCAFIVTVSGKMENISNSLRVLNLAKKVAQISLGQPRKNVNNISKHVSKIESLCQSG